VAEIADVHEQHQNDRSKGEADAAEEQEGIRLIRPSLGPFSRLGFMQRQFGEMPVLAELDQRIARTVSDETRDGARLLIAALKGGASLPGRSVAAEAGDFRGTLPSLRPRSRP